MKGPAVDPKQSRPNTFQGWQRVGCILGVAFIAVFAVLLMLGMVVGVLGLH